MRRLIPAVLLLGAACSDLLSPTRVAPYEYRQFVASGGTRIDTLTFRWPRSFLPVRIWVADDEPLRQPITTAISRWQGALLFGEFRAELVTDSSRADVIVRNVPSPGGIGLSRIRLDALAPECIGATDIRTDGALTQVILPMRVYIWPRFSPQNPNITTCYEITATHELGHVIGIISPNHSPDVGDVMFSNPVFNGLSERDISTAEVVSHITPTLVPTGRR